MEIKSVIESLEELDTCYQKLVEQARIKTRIIIENDIDKLMRITQGEKNLLKGIAAAESEFQEHSYAFMQGRGIRSRLKLTVSELARLVFKPDEKQLLLAAQVKLNDTLKMLKELNDHNQQLLDQSLKYVDFRLDLMIEDPTADYIYKRPDQGGRSTASTGRYDNRG